MKYAVVIEKAGSNYSAYVPDLPGCVATGVTTEDTEKEIREKIEIELKKFIKSSESIFVKVKLSGIQFLVHGEVNSPEIGRASCRERV